MVVWETERIRSDRAVLNCFPQKLRDLAKRSQLDLHEHMDETTCF